MNEQDVLLEVRQMGEALHFLFYDITNGHKIFKSQVVCEAPPNCAISCCGDFQMQFKVIPRVSKRVTLDL